jgi:hypothetical protein
VALQVVRKQSSEKKKPGWSSSPKVLFPITSKVAVSQIAETIPEEPSGRKKLSHSASSSSVSGKRQSADLDRDVFTTSMSQGGRRESGPWNQSAVVVPGLVEARV